MRHGAGADAPSRPLALLSGVATYMRGWSQSPRGTIGCCLRHCHGRRKKMACTSRGQWHQPWDGFCLWVLMPVLCPQSSVYSGAPCPVPPQGSCHSQGGTGTGAAPRYSLQLLQFLGATNISVNKEVCLFRVFLAASCPDDKGSLAG